MLGMFSFLQDANNYAERKVGNDQFDWGFVSTCRVSDGRKPYETAVEDNRYIRDDGKEGAMCIVECYDTKAEAEAGHAEWVKKMTAKRPPKKLSDCVNAEVAQLLDAVRGDEPCLTWTLRK